MQDNDATNNGDNNQNGDEIAPFSWPGIIGLALVIFCGLMAFVAHYYVNERSYSIKFFTETTFSFMALMVVIAQASIYLGQRRIMQRQWGVMRQQLKSSDAHSRNSLRAYINIRAGSVYIMEANRATAQIEIVNFGQTPANYVRTFIKAEIRLTDNPPPIPTAADILADEGDGIPMAPSMAVGRVVQTDHDVTAEEWEFLEQGKAHLFVWGIITYKTIFSKSKFTSFIWMNAFPAAYPGAGLTPFSEGNKAT